MTEQSEVLEESEITEETQTEESLQATEEAVETEEGSSEKPQSRSQNAKQRLRRKLGESEQRNSELADENRKLNERFSALEDKVDGVVNPPPPRPTRDNFETEENYEDALYEWRTPEVKPEAEPTPATERKDVLSPEVRKNWNEQMDIASDKYHDFEEKVFSIPHDTMTESMTLAITESETGGEVAYFLGKNPSEAERISKLGITAQVREIDKLTKKFTSTTSTAPTPITPTKGADSGIKDVSKMSTSEYRAHRRKERQAKGIT